jgi:DNA polymerase V
MFVTSMYPASETSESLEIPFFGLGVQAGFPSPAQDYLQETLDLNKFIVKNRDSTYFMRVEGDSMIDFRVFSGDLVVVDRSYAPNDGNLVIVALDGELVLRKLRTIGSRAFLIVSDTDDGLEITNGSGGNDTGVEMWGTVVWVLHDVH